MVEGKEEGEMSLRFSMIDAAGKLSAESQLDARTCECCTTAMAMTSAGPLIAYRDRTKDEIRDIAIVRPGAKPHVIHDDGWKIAGCPVNGPQADARGRYVVVAWFTAANDQPHVYVAFSRDAGATFGSPIAIDAGHAVGRVDVVMLDDSRGFVTWLEGEKIRGRDVTRDGALGEILDIGDSSSERAVGFARIALFAQRLYVTWTAQDADGKRVHIAKIALR